MASKYIGPSATFIYDDKEYHPGMNMPISAAAKRHHEQFGHRWEDSPEPAAVVPATLPAPLAAPAVTMPAPASGSPPAKD
jgi:hypothetical protein